MNENRQLKKPLIEIPIVKYLMLIAGGLVYSVGSNMFVVPINCYNAGVVGYAQLLDYICKDIFNSNFNFYIVWYIGINIPLIILAFRGVSRTFFLRTCVGVGSLALGSIIIPIPAAPLVQDILVDAVVGGVLTGAGVGLMLLAGGCGGGVDILGVYFAKKKPGMSVGKVSILVNAVLYAAVMVVFDIPTAVYSIIILVVLSITMDKIHFQNISMRCMIFTKKENVDKEIMKHFYRGVTAWEGRGAYTDETTHILVSCINKYEEHDFLETVKAVDPNAFIIIDENVGIKGNFIKKF